MKHKHAIKARCNIYLCIIEDVDTIHAQTTLLVATGFDAGLERPEEKCNVLTSNNEQINLG